MAAINSEVHSLAERFSVFEKREASVGPHNGPLADLVAEKPARRARVRVDGRTP